MNITDSNTVSYKCTNCGAPLHYTPGVLSIHCKYCDSTVAIKQEKNQEKKKGRKTSGKKEEEVFNIKNALVAHCPGCKAEFLYDEQANGKYCPICKTFLSQDDIHEGCYVVPSHILPFKATEKDFMKDVEDRLKKEKYINPFKKKSRIITIHKIFVPCWVDDVKVYTNDKELQYESFSYRRLYIPATQYCGDSIKEYSFDSTERNRLVPVNPDLIKEAKLLIHSFASPITNNTESLIEGQRDQLVGSSFYQTRGVRKIDKFSLVLLPFYECRFKFDRRKHVIYGSGYTGKFLFSRVNPFDLRKDFITICICKVLLLIILLLCLLITFCD